MSKFSDMSKFKFRDIEFYIAAPIIVGGSCLAWLFFKFVDLKNKFKCFQISKK